MTNSKHLRVYEDKSELHENNELIETFVEGILSNDAKQRVKAVKEKFEDGYLASLISGLEEGHIVVNKDQITGAAEKAIEGLMNSLTSEVGRALIGLSVMQLSIKAICDDQNIRLHKGGNAKNSFSWQEGISMRTLDKKFVTPVLRQHNLLRLNADGFMMTRSLAENYPYTSLYKAQLKGARIEWLELVDEVESKTTNAEETLKLLLSKLINAASTFTDKADRLIETIEEKKGSFSNKTESLSLISNHITDSDYAARLLEIGMHALIQSAIYHGVYAYSIVKPLTQMRSANKKHGNIGDIEILSDGEIIQAWDAKYGKGYLREEIEEISEKLQSHEEVELVGFVTTADIERTEEINKRITEIEELNDIELKVLSLEDWVDYIFSTALETELVDEETLAQDWISTYCEYLAQKRREQAPIDEPCLQWVESLIERLEMV